MYYNEGQRKQYFEKESFFKENSSIGEPLRRFMRRSYTYAYHEKGEQEWQRRGRM
ncbi:hypothetical protein RCG24_04275 [Neobacillus sp. OS1-32]|uniref:hypothetical protein n=1 Tax=Neobacillus sp. OS1-32 TaxID=3070682 RepID=UPI0027E13BDB|nr:hypothetical protein [Neobacillus sp. OS1-32]WML31107.1 hypothetical protein RCG24_04275 [Neobacillus sp. OS1-32]